MAHSLLQGAAFFTGVHARLEHSSKAAVSKSARLIRDEARRVLGTYDYGWPSLAESTIARKAHGDTPGLETGAMRKSIRYSVSGSRMNWTATVGSNDPKALWFELGTIKQPPRSFLAGAAMHMQHEVRTICGRNLFKSIFSSSHPDFEDEWSYDGDD